MAIGLTRRPRNILAPRKQRPRIAERKVKPVSMFVSERDFHEGNRRYVALPPAKTFSQTWINVELG